MISNFAGQYGGGAVFMDSRGELSGSLVSANIAYEGGGVFIYGGNVDLIGNEISTNEAIVPELPDEEIEWDAGGGGGGIWTSASDRIEGNTIADNVSGYNGGGAFFYRLDSTIDGNTVSGNWCYEDGGGLYFSYGTGMVSNNIIDGNEAADDGGGLRGYLGTFSVVDNVLSNNTAGDDGGHHRRALQWWGRGWHYWWRRREQRWWR